MTLFGVRKRVVSKRVVSADVPPERKPERGYVRQNHPFTKPPFYLPVTNSLSTTREGFSLLLQNYPRGEGNCETIERQKLSRGDFLPRHQDVSSGPAGAWGLETPSRTLLVLPTFGQDFYFLLQDPRTPEGSQKGSLKGLSRVFEGFLKGSSSKTLLKPFRYQSETPSETLPGSGGPVAGSESLEPSARLVVREFPDGVSGFFFFENLGLGWFGAVSGLKRLLSKTQKRA